MRSSIEEEEEHSVCSQCQTFQEERDERTKKYDESRREIETLQCRVRKCHLLFIHYIKKLTLDSYQQFRQSERHYEEEMKRLNIQVCV